MLYLPVAQLFEVAILASVRIARFAEWYMRREYFTQHFVQILHKLLFVQSYIFDRSHRN